MEAWAGRKDRGLPARRCLNKRQSCVFCMEILKDVEIIDLTLYFKKVGVLALSDFHFGYEDMLNAKGVFVPRHQFADIKTRLKHIFETLEIKGHKIEKIIVTGDLRHEFGFVSRQEMNDISEILQFMKKYCKTIIMVRGNHDTMAGFIKNRAELVDEFFIGGIMFLHGDVIPETAKHKDVKTIVIGHEHPAIKLTDTVTTEKAKTFLRGRWKRKTLIVLPSFNPLTEGTDVSAGRLLSPFLKQDLSNFESYAVPEENNVMYFGRLKKIIKETK